MSAWWIIVLVVVAGAFAALGILLYHSRMPELDRSASRHRSIGSGLAMRRRVTSVTFARSVHAAFGIVGLAGFLVALDRRTRGLGEALIGLAAMLGFLASVWVNYLRKQEER